MTETVRGLTGKPLELQPGQVAGAKEVGATPISAEEGARGTKAWQQMRDLDANWSTPEKALGGVFNGLTLGLGPAALAEAGLADRGDIEALHGSTAFQAGDIAGMVAPAFLTGGETAGARGALEAEGGLLGRALGWTPAGLLGRAGTGAEALAGRLLPEVGAMGNIGRSTLQMAARGATEGSLVNLAHTVSDSYIQDKPLTAQSLAASGVNGALLGGLAGGILGGVSGVAGAAGDLASSSMVGGGERAAAVALKRGGATEADLARMAQEEGGLVGAVRKYHDILENGGEGFGSKTSTIAKTMKDAESGYKAGIADVVKSLDEQAPNLVPDVVRVDGRIESDLQKFAGTAVQNDVSRVLGAVKEDLGALGAKSPGTAEASFMADRLHSGTWDGWIKSRNHLAEQVGKAQGTAQQEVYRTALNAVDDEISSAMDAAGEAIGNKTIGEQFRAAVMGQKMAQEYGQMATSKLGKELAGSASPLQGSDVGTMAWGTLMGHPIGAMGVVAAKAVRRLVHPVTEPAVAEAAYRAAVGAQAAKATAGIGAKVTGTLKKFMSVGGRVAAGESSERPDYTVKGFKKTMATSDKLLDQSHKAKVDDLTAALSQMGHPDLANEMAAQYQRATEYLNFNKPKDAKIQAAGSLGKLPDRMGLDTKEMRYMRIFSAISNPMSVVEGILDGTVSREAVNAIAYVMPEWHQDIVYRASQVILEAKEKGKFLPADKVATLGVVLNAPVDSKLEKPFIDEVQKALQANAKPQPAPGKPQQGGQLQLAQSADYKTPMQSSLG